MSQLSVTTAPMAEHSFALVNGGGVLAGGDYNPTTVQILAGNGTLVLNGTTLPSPVDDQVTAVVNGKVYILGGKSGANTTPPVLIGTTS
jgi:hypothetical protein